jgi:hypothetical protein
MRPNQDAQGRRRFGLAVLVVGWVVVASGASFVVVALAGRPAVRDERAGVGIAVIMAGMLVVLAGTYVHHRTGTDEP